jgi:hypothetical protein
MFGHEASVDTKNFRYGVLEPTEGLDRVWDQLHLAHRYRNTLVELELRRRQRIADAMSRLVPDVERLEWEEVAAELDKDIAVSAIKNANKEARKRVATKEQKETLRVAKQNLKEIRTVLYASRKSARENPEVKVAMDAINAKATEEAKSARANCGLYWGTYLTIEQSAQKNRSGRPPRFHRWTGDGKLAVQIQGGMSLDELFSCTDTRLRIESVPDDAWESGQPRKKTYTRCWFRIGSNGRDPIWTVLPLRLHRPLPAGSTVKWAQLLARRIGTQTRWYLVLTIANAPDMRPHAENGVVGVDLGWRLFNDGLRVAYWKGNDGRDGELLIPTKDLNRWIKAEDLRSIRDKNFNIAHEKIQVWRSVAPPMPDWFIEETKMLHAWRSTARLAVLVIKWRSNRFDGDAEIFSEMEAWRKQDRHLYEWEVNNRRKAVAWRDNLYKNFAANLAQRYHTCRIEGTDWRALAKLPSPEVVENVTNDAARRNRMVASPGRLSEILRDRFAESVDVDPSMTTQTCAACGKVDAFDAAIQVVRQCRHCGTREDQDLRAAKNILGQPRAAM